MNLVENIPEAAVEAEVIVAAPPDFEQTMKSVMSHWRK